MEETKELELELNNASHSTVLDEDNAVLKHTFKDIHLLSDLRGLTQAEEKFTMYYAVVYYCYGGDRSSQNFEKKNTSTKSNLFADSVLASDVQSVLATSSNSTTVMDFVR